MRLKSEHHHHHHHRRMKLPPILEIDEDGLPVSELEGWERPHWSADHDMPAVPFGDWGPVETED